MIRKIFIIDDHPVFCEGLRQLIERDRTLSVCGHSHDAAEAVPAILRLKPELALVDLGLPGRSGLDLIKDLQTLQPGIGVLAISMHDETLYAQRVLQAGGRGYITKQEPPEKILQAIQSVLDGQIYLSRRMCQHALDAFSSHHRPGSSPMNPLTPREQEILRWIGRGKDSRAIAARLRLSSKTVDTHRIHIKEKLGLATHTELVSYAARSLVGS